jgi:TusA-related sulfurtransferase
MAKTLDTYSPDCPTPQLELAKTMDTLIGDE